MSYEPVRYELLKKSRNKKHLQADSIGTPVSPPPEVLVNKDSNAETIAKASDSAAAPPSSTMVAEKPAPQSLISSEVVAELATAARQASRISNNKLAAMVSESASAPASSGLPQEEPLPAQASSLSPTPVVQPVQTEQKKVREVTPTYGIDMKLTKEQVKDLLSVAGDHSVTEDEWVRACHLLGDYRHEPERARRRKKFVPVTIALFLMLGGCVFWNFQVSQQVPVVPVAIAPALEPSPTDAPPVTAVEPDFKTYMTKLQYAIKKAWHPLKANESNRAKVTFKIDSAGNQSHIVLVQSTGHNRADEAALNAIRTAKLPPLPPGAEKIVDVAFTFDYNVFTDGEHPISDENSPTASESDNTNGDVFGTDRTSGKDHS